MNKQQVLEAIEIYIKSNGIQGISGDILNLILSSIAKIIPDDAMLTSSFGGTVTPTSNISVTPGHQKWFFGKAGTYANANGVIVPPDNIGIISYDGTQYSAINFQIPQATQYVPKFTSSTFPLDGYVQRLHNDIYWELPLGETATASDIPGVSSKWKQAVESPQQLRQTIGVDEVAIGTNFISELVGSDLNNTELWSPGYLNKANVPSNSSTFRYSKKYYKIEPGSYDFRIAIYGNAVVNYYDANFNIVGFLERGSLSSTIFLTVSDIPTNAVYIRISHYYGNGALDGTASGGHPTTNIYVKNKARQYKPTENVFVLNSSFVDKTNTLLKNDYGVKLISKGTEFLTGLIGSQITDTSLWEPGFLRQAGTVENGASWYHTKNYIKIPAGTYSYHFYYAGNARAILYNYQTKAIEITLSNSLSSDGHNGTFTTTKDMWMKFSHRESSTDPTRINLISLKNTADIKPVLVNSFNIGEYANNGGGSSNLRQSYKDTFPPKQRKKIATFICDDGHINDKLWYLPLLAEYGVKSTLAISKHWVVGGESSRLNRADIIQFHKDGHDIANHTVNHFYFIPASPAPPMPLEQAESEVLDNKLFLEDLINDEVPMFISPFGMRNANLDYIISKYHKANFISGYATNNPTPLDSFFINRVSFDVAASGTLIFDTKLKPAIDDAAINNQWLVFAVHSGYAEYNLSNTVDRRQELRQTIQYLIAQGFEIMTAKRAYSYYKNPVEIGVKRYSSKYYALGMDGSEINIDYFS